MNSFGTAIREELNETLKSCVTKETLGENQKGARNANQNSTRKKYQATSNSHLRN